ncbi:hypothetical protein JTE90_017421 [Oedothorax gibbosus]|uniref:Uncharacterized protein n=1 Tax=Oedothorax gibbosus TaxID=931172 RepID=A0AAV6U8H5_9ARAC|nr:hypothetical protein JTE90_017421 [Oedothorax gibbosus]
MNCLPCAVLSSHKSVFWRPQRGKPETHLATVEALYYFVRDVFALSTSLAYDGRYDNLLFFFRHTHRQLRQVYRDKLDAK